MAHFATSEPVPFLYKDTDFTLSGADESIQRVITFTTTA